MAARDVLWTGGWDSTYRVLELSLVHGVRVRPHYLVDPGRESTSRELAAIEAIRAAAIERGADIDPPRLQRIDSIPLSTTATEQHRCLRKRFHIGSQYLWLAEYARQNELVALELCIHRDDRAYAVCKAMESGEDAHGTVARSGEQPESLFRFFALPVLDLTKERMRETACAHEFDDLLEKTWFCHRPTRRGQPCGFCNPCRWTREEGLGHRLPPAATLRSCLDRYVVSCLPGFRAKRSLRKWIRAAG